MKKFNLLIGTLILGSVTFAQASDSPVDLLKASDRARGGVEDGLLWKSEIETTEDGEVTTREFNIKAKGIDALAEATLPLRTKGEIYVFNDRNMWYVKPGLKKPVAISSRAKLTGLASNGDIASTWYSRDYDATVEKTETLNKEKVIVLMLKAKSEKSTYDQIRYWISEKSKLAVQAEYLTLKGQPLKMAKFEYKNKITSDGKTLPFVSRMEIQDSKRKDYKSVIKYSNLKISKFRTGEFNINNVR